MDEDFIQLFQNPQFTPDQFLLEQAPRHLILECGPLWYNVPYLGTAYTVEKMSLWVHTQENGGPDQAIPVRMSSAPRCRVRGTLYSITSEMMMKLDKKRQNGLSFERKQIPVVIPNGSHEPIRLTKPVWMYKAKKDHWLEQIEYDRGLYRGRLGSAFELAPTFPDNQKFLNNHYSFSGIPIEVTAGMVAMAQRRNTPEFIRHTADKNNREIARIHWQSSNLLGKLKSFF